MMRNNDDEMADVVIVNDGSHLLLPSTAAYDLAGYDSVPPFATIFNDLTYSDDDEDELDIWDEADHSSPETVALMEEILSKSILGEAAAAAAISGRHNPTQMVNEQSQSHLIHPLAQQHYLQQQIVTRHESFGSFHVSSEADEGSALAYSITSRDDIEEAMGRGSQSSTSTMNCGTLEPLDEMTTNCDLNFGHLPTMTSKLPLASFMYSHMQYAQQYFYPQPEQQQQQQQQQQLQQRLSPGKSSPKTTLKPRIREFLVHEPPSPPHSATNGIRRQYSSMFDTLSVNPKSNHLSINRSNNIKMIQHHHHQKQQIHHQQQQNNNILTPSPFRIDESPVTSATVTENSRTPSTKERSRRPRSTLYNDESDIEDAAARKICRHKRLRRIRKAAEAREAAVRIVRGTEQRYEGGGRGRRRCNDVPCAFAFVCQFVLISMSAFAFAPEALRDWSVYGPTGGEPTLDGQATGVVHDHNPFAGLQSDDIVIMDRPKKSSNSRGGQTSSVDDDVGGISRIDYVKVIQLVSIASGYACLCSFLALGFMMMLSTNLIHSTLIFSIAVSLIWTIVGWAYGSKFLIIPVSGGVSLTLSFIYTVWVWNKISFASTNLSVALKAMRSMLSIIFVGLCVSALTFLWTIWWMCSFIGSFNFLYEDKGLSNDWIVVVVSFYIFSYCWTFQVLKGISQTTVASIIWKWWGMSEDDRLPVCSDHHSRITLNIIGSFGSICLAGLFVEPCNLLTRISTIFHAVRCKHNGTSNVTESSYIQGDEAGNLNNIKMALPPDNNNNVISRNVNQWSYVYIGLYGYEFWDSGSKASQLFEARGWTQIVSDLHLIVTVMGISNMIIGGSTAFMGLIVEEVDGYYFTSIHRPIETAFLLCLFAGYFLSSAFLSIVEGCVNSILVCYAASPVEFHANHPQLSEEMKKVWKYFWIITKSSRPMPSPPQSRPC